MDPAFLAAGAAATLLTGISKGGFGGGIGGIAVPILALVISPLQAVGVMAPVLIAMDVLGIWFYRAQVDGRLMRIILPAGLVGTALGWALFRMMSDDWIRILLGIISVTFVAWNLVTRKPRAENPSVAKGRFWACVSGFTSFVAHSGSPPLAVFLLGLKIDKAAYVGTVTVFFTVLNAIKIVPYWELGLFTRENLVATAWLLPIALFGIWLGVQLNQRVSQVMFFRIVNLMLGISGVKLLWDGISALAG